MATALAEPSPQPWGLCLRISKARRQDGTVETLGVERQEPPTRELIERLGGVVARVYTRNDLSAYTGGFPFPDALQDLRDGVIIGLAAWSLDRLTRRTNHASILRDAVRDTSGAQIATVNGGVIDLTSSAGRLNFNVLSAVAEFSSDISSERVLLKLEQNAQAGRPHGGKRRVGFLKNGIDHHPEEADWLREAADAILGGKSVGSIVTAWNDAGRRTPSGRLWAVTTLRRALTNPSTAGFRVHQGEIVGDAQWKPVLDRDVWTLVCRRFGVDPNRPDRLPGRGAGGGRPAVHLLSGWLYCGRDHDPPVKLYARRQRGRFVYLCDPGRNGCELGIVAELVEDHVTRRVLELLDDDRIIRRLLDTGDDARDMTLAVEEESLAAKLERIDDAWDDGVYTKPEWLRRRGPVVQRLEQVRAQRARVQPKRNWIRLGDSPIGTWLAGDLATRRQLLRLVVGRVVVHPVGKGTGGRFDPGRIEVIPQPELTSDRHIARIVNAVLRAR